MINAGTNPMMAVMNALGYDAMTLGNHEFNYGSEVFQGVLGQADVGQSDGYYGTEPVQTLNGSCTTLCTTI